MLFCMSELRLSRVRIIAQACLSLRHCTKISCAASNGDLCAIHASRVDSSESAHLRRHISHVDLLVFTRIVGTS